MKLRLRDGVGISLVNNVPEELLYLEFKGINVNYSWDNDEQLIDASIYTIKVRSLAVLYSSSGHEIGECDQCIGGNVSHDYSGCKCLLPQTRFTLIKDVFAVRR